MLNDLIKELAPKWYQIGKCLLKEVWTHKLNTIEKNNPESAEACCDELLAYWFDSCEANWSKMIGALEKINQDAPVQMIKSDDSIRGS